MKNKLMKCPKKIWGDFKAWKNKNPVKRPNQKGIVKTGISPKPVAKIPRQLNESSRRLVRYH